eukprot:393742_1
MDRAGHTAHVPTHHSRTRSPDAMRNSLSLNRTNCSFAKSAKSLLILELDNLDPPVRSVSEILYESRTFVVAASNEDQYRAWLRTTKRAILAKAMNRHLARDLNTEIESSKHVLRVVTRKHALSDGSLSSKSKHPSKRPKVSRIVSAPVSFVPVIDVPEPAEPVI